MAAKPADVAAAAAADREARRAIAQDLGTTLLVEAAAGTGKTTSLVTRMVALIREGRATVDRLSAVTFTVKAARQLAQRFQEKLEEALAAEPDLVRRGRLEEALAGRSSAFLGTIHAFCARLLRERPVEAGVDPGFEEMEETEDVVARTEAWERYVQRLFVEESPLLSRLAELGIALHDLRETYGRLCENSDVLPAVSPELPRPDLSAARDAAVRFLAKARPEMPAAAPPDGWDSFAKALREALRLESVLDLTKPAQFLRVLEAFDRAKQPVPKRWPRKEKWALSFWTECQPLQEALVRPALTRWREYLHPVVIGALEPAVREYAAWRRRNGRCNFQDLLLLARDLLRDHPQVRRSFQERFTPLLVDEFQDTDPIQAEVILYLTGRDTSERDWRKLEPLPGSLFVVGDPKQSIYRFRRADIETYAAVRRIIERSGGRRVTLTTNFRSAERLCAWANAVFEKLLPAEHTETQAAHIPLVPQRKDRGPVAGAFRLEITTGGRAKDSEVVRADAERIGACIEAMLRDRERELLPGDFLVLLRYRRNMPIYARALEARGIPYEISGGGAFRASEEIAALLAFLRAVADPDDPVSLAATLRGPLFGVDDRALYLFHRSRGRFSFLSEPPPGTDPRILRAWELLREARRLADELPPGAAIARIAETLGWTAHAAAQELGRTRAGNLLKAATAARELGAAGEPFAGVVKRLAGILETEEDHTEEMSIEPGRKDAVQLMTLHRAKGLEARVVFLADPTKDREPEAAAWIDRSSDPPRGHFLVCKRAGEYGFAEMARPLEWDKMQVRELRFQEAERDRLLYVAATRAAETLVVSARRQRSAKGRSSIRGPWARLDPFLVEELPEPAVSRCAPPVPRLRDVSRELTAFRERRATRLAASAEPTYSVTQVTRVAHSLPLPLGEGQSEGEAAAAPLPFRQRTGRGMSWGRVIHQLLEALMRDPKLPLREYAQNLLAEEERPPEDLEEAIRLVERVRGSNLWQRALRARHCLVEVPFALKVASAQLGLATGPSETLLQGAIDLAFEEDSGWILVDYKSDTVSNNFQALVNFYAPQIAHYRRYWQKLTGRPTKAGLFFVETGQEAWLEEK